MTRNTRIVLIAASIGILSVLAFAKEAGDAGHIQPEIGEGISTSTTPHSEIIPEVKIDLPKPISPILKDDTKIEDRAVKIDAYFEKRGMPLAGYGSEFVAKADEYGIDWTLLAAISVAESSGGKQMCNFNPFGWGSCRSGVGDFSSISEAIDYVSMNLGGHNPRTAGAYSGNSEADLWSYNGTVDPLYPGKVMRYMRDIMETPLP
jgi:hypothetical protein